MKQVSFVLFCILLLSSCSHYKFWDISRFNISDSALKENEEIKILYTSRGPDANKNQEYYIHIIAVSQQSGDTVNILTTVDNGFTQEDKDKVFNFISQNNEAAKYFLMDPEKFKDVKHLNDLPQTSPKKITKVVRDPDFDNFANNKYPTVIGFIVTISK